MSADENEILPTFSAKLQETISQRYNITQQLNQLDIQVEKTFEEP